MRIQQCEEMRAVVDAANTQVILILDHEYKFAHYSQQEDTLISCSISQMPILLAKTLEAQEAAKQARSEAEMAELRVSANVTCITGYWRCWFNCTTAPHQQLQMKDVQAQLELAKADAIADRLKDALADLSREYPSVETIVLRCRELHPIRTFFENPIGNDCASLSYLILKSSTNYTMVAETRTELADVRYRLGKETLASQEAIRQQCLGATDVKNFRRYIKAARDKEAKFKVDIQNLQKRLSAIGLEMSKKDDKSSEMQGRIEELTRMSSEAIKHQDDMRHQNEGLTNIVTELTVGQCIFFFHNISQLQHIYICIILLLAGM